MTAKTSIDDLEVAKFAAHASQWWDTEGPLKTLHDINPTRIHFIEKCAPLAGQRVLDVGCGGGVLSEGLARKGAFVTGLDVDSQVIAVATSHAKEQRLAIDYVCEPIETYQAPAFNMITCMEMLEHVPQPALVIEHCARLLAPGGYLFLSTLNRTLQAYASVIVAAEYILGLLPRQTHDYDKFIKPSELAAIARAVKLESIDLKGMAYNPLIRQASLVDSVQVNYLMVFRKVDES